MGGIRMNNDYITLANVLSVYEKEISKNVKNKKRVYNFEVNKMQNIMNITKMLKNHDIGVMHYNVFLIHEPKERLVMSLSVQGKIINHFLARYILEKNLTKYLDARNIATRKNMGTDYGVKLVIKYINILKRKHKTFYVLKIDISKYFYSIDHAVLKGLLEDKLEFFEYKMMCDVIDSTNNPKVLSKIKWIKDKFAADIPLYEVGKGLPIGNMTSQFLSIFYLYKIDHYIVHNLHIKYYVRYMDDFILMDENKEKLEKALDVIVKKLKDEYKLNVNPKKTNIVNIKDGFSFLGYTFKIKGKKNIIKIKKSNVEKIKKRVKIVKCLYNKGKISLESAFSSVMTYSNTYKYADNRRVLRVVERYFYDK